MDAEIVDDNMDGGSDSSDDPVLESFDLYLNPSASAHLHLLQFPLRHCDRPYGDQGKLLKVEVGFDNEDGDIGSVATKKNKDQKHPGDSGSLHDPSGTIQAASTGPEISNFRFRYQLEPEGANHLVESREGADGVDTANNYNSENADY